MLGNGERDRPIRIDVQRVSAFGAGRFSELCRELEERAKSDELNGTAELFDRIEREYAALEATLAALRSTLSS